MFKQLMYKLGNFLANALSLKAAYRLAVFISDLHYFFSFRDRRAVKENLRVILPDEKNVAPIARALFRNFGKYLVEFFRIVKYVDEDYIAKNVKIENQHYLDETLKKGKGGILLTAHFGNWELGSVIVSLLRYPIEVIALPHKERPINDLFDYKRMAKGIRVIPTNIALRRCLEALKDNHFLALAADRDFGNSGEVIKFFGKNTSLPKGAAAFARKLETPILPIFLLRQKNDTFILRVEQPLFADSTKDEETCVRDLIMRYAKIMEKKIKENPSQWLVFRKFWVE